MDAQTGEPEQQRISVLDPISQAIDWATQVLFRPFDFEKWITLGFCAWLALLGEQGGGSSSSNWRSGRGGGDLEHSLHQAWDWIVDHLIPVLLITGLVITVIIVIWLLVVWLSSRGKFMFVDGVVNDRGAVVAPWRQYRELANSLFGFRVIVGLVGSFVVLTGLAIGGTLVWFRIVAHEFDAVAIAALILLGLGFLAIVMVLVLVNLAINDFVVPVMYLRGCRVVPAWREFGALLSARPGTFILYVLVCFLIAIVFAVLALLACCLTCCLALLPYIGTVILLPMHVFRRAYSLYFLGQFGPRYARFAKLGPEEELTNIAESPQ